VEEDLTTDNKFRVVNGKRLLMKRRRKPYEQSTSETTTTSPQFENPQFNTIQTGFRASIPTTQTPFFRSQPRPSPQSTKGPKLPNKI
jgi:hypothetical protein